MLTRITEPSSTLVTQGWFFVSGVLVAALHHYRWCTTTCTWSPYSYDGVITHLGSKIGSHALNRFRRVTSHLERRIFQIGTLWTVNLIQWIWFLLADVYRFGTKVDMCTKINFQSPDIQFGEGFGDICAARCQGATPHHSFVQGMTYCFECLRVFLIQSPSTDPLAYFAGHSHRNVARS